MNANLPTGTARQAAVAILHIMLAALICLVVSDIIGTAVVFVMEVLFNRFSSGLLFYAIWLVAGIFCGLYFVSYAQPVAAKNPFMAAHTWLAPAAGTVLAVLLLIALHWMNELDAAAAGDHWVPGHKGLTFTFFACFVAAAFFFGNILRQQPGNSGKPRSR